MISGLTDYYHVDHLDSTRLITDKSGSRVTATATIAEPFQKVLKTCSTIDAWIQNFVTRVT